MCGILGQVNRTRSIDRIRFEAMLETLSKRGPDQSGLFVDNNIALGHRRLSIIDLSEAGKQPMSNEDDNLHIVFNGEIYNYQEVRRGLSRQYTWRSKTDTEVLLHGYEEYGEALINTIEGMFAFAIYDKSKGIITLARDHFGKKPLYYYLDDEMFCFASELKALLANKEIRSRIDIDSASLIKYIFYGYVPSPHSIVTTIKKLEPSTIVQFDLREWKFIHYRRFWNLGSIRLAREITENEALKETQRLLESSVRKRLMSDVPLGIFLSGGVDSTAIAAYLSRYSPNVSGFTVSYKDQERIDESVYASRVAKQLGIEYYQCEFDDHDVLSYTTKILNYLDEPLADAAVIPLYFVSKFAKERITVVLSGDGGDEVFGGYTKYRAQQIIERFGWLSFLAPLVSGFTSSSHPLSKLMACYALPFSVRQFILGSGSPLPDDAKGLLNQSSLDLSVVFEDATRAAQRFLQSDVVNKALYLDCAIQLPDGYLVKGDRATMATSLEMRNPFLDKALAEFLFALPGNDKVRHGETKYLLKKIVSQYVDPSIVYRPKKGFAVPLNDWIRGPLRAFYNDYLFVDHGYFKQEWVEQRFREHCDKKTDHTFLLMRIMHFNYWYKTYYAS